MRVQQYLPVRLVTVGMKILLGVALASNLFIGVLLYVNLQSTRTVEQKVNEVIAIREKLSTNLREAVVSLQDDFFGLPAFFKIDITKTIHTAVARDFTISDRQVLKGRSAYSSLYKRKERRDLTKNKFIVQSDESTLTLSKGLFDSKGNFSDAVERLTLLSSNPVADARLIEKLIAEIVAEAASPEALSNKVRELGAMVADTTLEAENTRNETVQQVENIMAIEDELEQLRTRQKEFTLVMGAAAILANMIVLFILVRRNVERPLHSLTKIIEEIRAGKSTDIPYIGRRDQIGILSGAISNFSEALVEIRESDNRKAREKIIIEEMFNTITDVVNTLDLRAKDLVATADTLQELASSTENRIESVTQRAGSTAENTDKVSQSTTKLQSSLDEITSLVNSQNHIVGDIIESNSRSRDYISRLNSSITDIHTIIATVSEITDQTKLLALNATIEAARAGEAGRGFNVVASEVKDLSYKTDRATQDVMSKITAIEKASAILFSNLSQTDQRMQNLEERTETISGSISLQQAETSTIAGLASLTSENTRDVSASIIEVGSAATQTRDLAGQVHISSGDISTQLSTLLVDTRKQLEELSVPNVAPAMHEPATA